MVNTREPTADYEIKNCYDADDLEFADYCQKAYEKTKERLVAADCLSASRRLKQYMAQFTASQTSMRIMGVDWTSVLDSLLELYCRDAILHQIKHTPKIDRGKWTKVLLDRKIEICGLDAAVINEIYEAAGLELDECTFKITKFPRNKAEPMKETISMSEYGLEESG